MATSPNPNKIAQEIISEARKMNAETREDIQPIAEEILRAYGLTFDERQAVKTILEDKFGGPSWAKPSER